ncbi:Fe-S osidoreductase [Ignicoccus islandicus DSM 13165]|uniref:Fe-S osidoreductase n=1 Tax=Ignicoccus islandicus DSM 13165 TaxID=940295 RepID=A0A0U3F6D1_9CREN|nr:radical SAM protein [Ignicoccus islandicus]ALU11624.1 Fe-S osidoreductase [Ignicoccus islandicus DSM 13165]
MKGPTGIIWILTGKCNLNCLHCYASRFTKWGPEVDKEVVSRVLNEAIEMGLRWVNFSGGEVLIYKKWLFEIFKDLLDKKVYPSVVSNGTAITEETARKLRGVYVYVSIDGPKHIHEQIRGAGTWNAVLRGINNLKKHGVEFAIIMAINPLNYNKVIEVGELAYKLGASEFIIIPTMPFGMARETKLHIDWKNFLLSLHQMNYLLTLYEIRGGAWCAPWSRFIVRNKRFHAGNCRKQNTIDIGPDGSVMLCDVLDFRLGKVTKSSFKEVWLNYLNHPLVREIKRPRGHLCSKCPFFNECLGGCYARALTERGTLEGDPLCPFLNEGFRILTRY